jgi:hypothetical protein
MTKLITAIASLLMFALPATSGAANTRGRWLTYPTCSATTTTLTCSGRAAIADPQTLPELGQPVAAVIAQAQFSCTDPDFSLFWPPLRDLRFQYVGGASFHNGRTLSIQVQSTNIYPSNITAMAACAFGHYVRDDPNYYNVSVVVGWAFGSATPVTVLEAPIGTVSPQ